jgi:hypothetical protein
MKIAQVPLKVEQNFNRLNNSKKSKINSFNKTLMKQQTVLKRAKVTFSKVLTSNPAIKEAMMLSNASVLNIKETGGHFLINQIASMPLGALHHSKILISGTIIKEILLKKSMSMSNTGNLDKLSNLLYIPLPLPRE